MIVEDVDGGSVSEASQAGAVVGCDEAQEEEFAFGMAGEPGAVTRVVADLGHGPHRFGETPVEPLDHAIGLRPVWTGGAVDDPGPGAEAVKGMLACGARGMAGF